MLAAEQPLEFVVFGALSGAHAQPFGAAAARQVAAIHLRRRFQGDGAEFVVRHFFC
jgi:hypothetical protein